MNRETEDKVDIETRLTQDIWVKTCYITDKEGLQHEVIHYGDLKDVIREVTGWMQNHDHEMYMSGMRDALGDDSGSYDALIQHNITEDDVKKWCFKRNLVVITHDFYHEMSKRWSEAKRSEIVKCKDCLMHGVCRYEIGLGKDGFCSQGRRKRDEGFN